MEGIQPSQNIVPGSSPAVYFSPLKVGNFFSLEPPRWANPTEGLKKNILWIRLIFIYLLLDVEDMAVHLAVDGLEFNWT